MLENVERCRSMLPRPRDDVVEYSVLFTNQGNVRCIVIEEQRDWECLHGRLRSENLVFVLFCFPFLKLPKLITRLSDHLTIDWMVECCSIGRSVVAALYLLLYSVLSQLFHFTLSWFIFIDICYWNCLDI